MNTLKSIEERIDQLHADGIVDLHFDLPMDLYEKRERKNVLETEFLPELDAGNIGAVGVAIYNEEAAHRVTYKRAKILRYRAQHQRRTNQDNRRTPRSDWR